MIRVRPDKPVRVGVDDKYLYDPSVVEAEVQQAKDWATKTDGMVEEDGVPVDYSAKAHAIGGKGTETNNAKYYAEQAGQSATSASDSATSASNSATIASDKATIATTQAGIATTAANTATTQAGIATSKATEASGYASSANVSAQQASTSETNASIWAEGSDGQVALLGGEKSSKGWAARAKEIVDSIGSVLRYKGSVNTRADLPITGQVIGDMYNILSDGSNVVWNGSDWDDISGIVDLSEYRKAAAQDTIDAGKVPTSRTVNGKALSSDISLTASDVGALPGSTVIPTVNNPTITLTQGGVTKGTFTLNQSSNKTIDFEATGATGANTSLSNLTSTGKNLGNWSTNISNCITEIPQDINLTLENGTLTLKSGSKAYRPDGNQYQLDSDRTIAISVSGKYLIYSWSLYSLGSVSAESVYSGATAPTGTGKLLWYDTTNNMIKESNDGGSTWNGNILLPFAIVTVSNGLISSIDKVFNGAGYIGHHAFVLPGVKVLGADGFNSDGSLKSATYSNNSLRIIELQQSGRCLSFSTTLFTRNGYQYVKTESEITPVGWNLYYIQDKNEMRLYNGSLSILDTKECPIVLYNYDGTSVTQFDVRQPVRLATTEMLDKKQDKSGIKMLSSTDSITLADNTIYNGGEQTALTIALPATDTIGFICDMDFSSGNTATTLSYSLSDIFWAGVDVAYNATAQKEIFTPVANKRYTIVFYYDGVNYNGRVGGV